jgi:hypothetical protein
MVRNIIRFQHFAKKYVHFVILSAANQLKNIRGEIIQVSVIVDDVNLTFFAILDLIIVVSRQSRMRLPAFYRITEDCKEGEVYVINDDGDLDYFAPYVFETACILPYHRR